jgi:hypothetical protein
MYPRREGGLTARDEGVQGGPGHELCGTESAVARRLLRRSQKQALSRWRSIIPKRAGVLQAREGGWA